MAMATLCRAYASVNDARAAVDRLLSAGLPRDEVQVLVGDAIDDARDTPVGGYAGTTTPAGEAVGSYADGLHSGREAVGAYAGDADGQRRGDFGDVDRDTVTTYPADAGIERVRIASHRHLRNVLLDAGLDEATAAADVEALHRGQVLVLVQSATRLDEISAVMDA